MRTYVYVDGFNLYYQALHGTRHKWLDLAKLASTLLPREEIVQIRSFTALVHPRPDDLGAPVRQQVYLRALSTIPNLTITVGQFRPRQKRRPLVTPISTPTGKVTTAEFHDTEEKGSDVNLATMLLVDGFLGRYEQALVISNDSDLAIPAKTVKDDLRLRIGVVNPNLDQRAFTPNELRAAASFELRLFPGTPRKCQFPTEMADARGVFRKPPEW